MDYKMIRGPIAEARCKNKSTYGSPLYCDCGCQTPREDDPKYNIEGVTVGEKYEEGYADYRLMRDGKCVGSVNTQYSAIFLDGNEYLGVKPVSPLMVFVEQALKSNQKSKNENSGSTLAETYAQEKMLEKAELTEQDRLNEDHPGYCPKCHTYCYGDCEA